MGPWSCSAGRLSLGALHRRGTHRAFQVLLCMKLEVGARFRLLALLTPLL